MRYEWNLSSYPQPNTPIRNHVNLWWSTKPVNTNSLTLVTVTLTFAHGHGVRVRNSFFLCNLGFSPSLFSSIKLKVCHLLSLLKPRYIFCVTFTTFQANPLHLCCNFLFLCSLRRQLMCVFYLYFPNFVDVLKYLVNARLHILSVVLLFMYWCWVLFLFLI